MYLLVYSLTTRSFFGTQKGPFSLEIQSLSAYKGDWKMWEGWVPTPRQKIALGIEDSNAKSDNFPYPYLDYPRYEKSEIVEEKQGEEFEERGAPSWLCGFCCC